MNWIRLAVVCFLSALACVRLQGFTEGAIAPLLSNREVVGIELPPGPYRYVGRGHQSFVFANEAGVVLKLFNERRFTLPWPLNQLRPKWAQSRAKKRAATYTSYELAWEVLREETGLLGLHFGATEGLPLVEVENPAHVSLRLDLNGVPFVLQRQGQPFYPEVERRIGALGEAGLRASIDQLVDFVNGCADRGVVDSDRDVEINFGIRGERSLLFDPGRLHRVALAQQEPRAALLRKATRRFRDWLAQHHPEGVPYLESVVCAKSAAIPPRGALERFAQDP